MEIEI
jgi:hypothetical protein